MEAHYIFHPNTIWVRPLFTELGPKNPLFAKKQTNICRLSGDINCDNGKSMHAYSADTSGGTKRDQKVVGALAPILYLAYPVALNPR